MNFKKLFDMQRQLDNHIIKEKGLEGQDLLDKKILALQVELGELANEARFFKFWSNDQEPRRWYPNENDVCESCNGNPIFIENGKIVGECKNCDGCGVHFYNPLLEEYVDCLHFILSIGLDIGVEIQSINPHLQTSATDQFVELNYQCYRVLQKYEWGKSHAKSEWILLSDLFVGLGEMLGITWEQIEQAYLFKNEVNHERQESGY
ncbi:dUTP diphosphatase [Salinibacillus aidingensis]|uniref:dUTP diphosphatase n=1 Tax=Salinibacillus aidingensis TaxID=237684 RepID=A0ABN1B682_9BACI